MDHMHFNSHYTSQLFRVQEQNIWTPQVIIIRNAGKQGVLESKAIDPLPARHASKTCSPSPTLQNWYFELLDRMFSVQVDDLKDKTIPIKTRPYLVLFILDSSEALHPGAPFEGLTRAFSLRRTDMEKAS